MGLSGAPWQDAQLPHLTEAELAAWDRARGRPVVERAGRHWAAIAPGFYQPIHYLARLREQQIVRPRPFAWGYRAVLEPGDAHRANASLPVHMLPDPAGYTLERLQPRRRQQLRKALREVEFIALDDPAVVIDRGYTLADEAHRRNRDIALPERVAFAAWVAAFMAPRRGLVLAAVRDGELLGVSFSFAVDGVDYEHMTYVGAAGLAHNIALSLFHVKVLIVQRTPGVTEIVNGLHAPENPSLCEFKERQGLVVARLPARLVLQPLARAALRRWRPRQYYRLAGTA